MGKKERSPWSRQVARLPEWISIQRLSEACEMHPKYLEQVKRGAAGLNSREAKRVIRELKKLEGIVSYRQTELF